MALNCSKTESFFLSLNSILAHIVETLDVSSCIEVKLVSSIYVVVYSFLIINDMIETDKVGSYFFLCLAMLVRLDFIRGQALLKEADSCEQEK